MNRVFHLLSALVVLGLLVACAPATRVILLPEADGRPTAVEVTSAAGVQRLSGPYQSVEVGKDGQLQLRTLDARTVKERYGAALALLPAAAEQFLLYFEPGSSVLTVESKALLPAILMRAGQRSGGEIIVIGHTDRVGALEANDALSLQRARAIRELLVAQGFKPELVEAVGRGEREPLVPTEDEVDEPRNRRAEIVVR
jgi:outer membrane protein OmpA-like peptidoglycan-associated protein